MLTAHLEVQLKSFLADQPIFSPIGEQSLSRLVQQLELVSFAMGQEVFGEGDAADCAYVVYSGRARVFKQGPQGKPILLGTLFPGDLVGEQALTRQQARSASVRAADDLVLLRLDRAIFERLLQEHAELAPYLERLERQRAAGNFLRLATFLGALPAKQVIAMLDTLDECVFQKGEVIVRQGEAGDRMYIVKSGQARVVRDNGGQETELAYLGQGDYFGERALILNEPRFASVTATENVECFSLNRQGFESLVTSAPQLQEQLRRRLEQYEHATEAAARPLPESAPVQARSLPVDLDWETAPLPAGPKARAVRRPWFTFFRRFPFVAQEDETDCGAASLAMIARYHGLRLSVAWLRDLAHVGAGGASMLGLVKAAEAAGFHGRAVSTDFDHLADLSLPAIAHWKGFHYLVLYEVRDNRVFLADPAAGRLQMSRREFEAHWTGKLLLLTFEGRGSSDQARKAGTEGVVEGARLLAPLTHHNAPLVVLALLASVLLALSALVLPLGTRLLIDRVLLDEDGSHVPAVCAGLLLGALGVAMAALMRQRLLDRVWPAFIRKVRADWFGRLLKTPLSSARARPLGAFLTRLEETHQAESLAVRMAVTALFDMPLLAAALGLMFIIHPGLALAALLGLAVPAGLALAWWRGWRVDQYESWLAKTADASMLVESLEALPAIKDANAEAFLAEKFANAALVRPVPSQRLTGTACWLAVLLFASTLTFAYGANLVLSGQLTAGDLAAFHVALGLATVSIAATAGLAPVIGRLQLLLRRLRDVWEVPSEGDAPISVPRLRGLIQLQQVDFRFHPESPKVLSGINLTIPAGQMVAIIGRAGAGKTTLAMLLQRLYQPTDGSIRIDGIEMNSMPVSSFRAQVSLVGQEPALLAGSVRDNIALADPQAASERVIEAARLAGAHDFIMAWPQGYETTLGAGGMRPSAGQAQALCLARALLKDPRVLILDDVLSALDLDSEAVVLKNLRAARGRTTILLSRRPLPPTYADLIVVLDAGQIVEAGSHHELLQRRGLYYYWTGLG